MSALLVLPFLAIPLTAESADTDAPSASPTPSASPAQSPEPSPVRDSVAGLLFGTNEFSAEFHGFVNVEYYSLESGSEHPDPSFDLHNFYLSAKAQITPSVTLFGEVEHEHGAEIRVDRAFVDWRLSPLATIRLGRFYVPFSYERNHYWAPARPMSSRPLLVDLPFHEWSDSGAEIFGSYRWFGWDLAVVNGPAALTESGIAIEDDRDSNVGKVPVARVTFKPLPFIETGLAYAQGTYDPANKLKFQLFEADARIRWRRLDVWSEFDQREGDDEPCSFATDPSCNPLFTGDPARKQGAYILAGYSVIEDAPLIHYLKPMIRFDYLEALDSGAGKRRVTAGLNWSPYAHFLIKAEAQLTREYGQPQVKDDGVMFSAVADF